MQSIKECKGAEWIYVHSVIGYAACCKDYSKMNDMKSSERMDFIMANRNNFRSEVHYVSFDPEDAQSAAGFDLW